MPYYQSTYHSRLYRDFKAINPVAYRDIVRFFEEKEDGIRKLDEEEHFEMMTAYVDALFEIGAYQKHLLMVDLVIETSIRQNIQQYHGEDIYRKMLFRKAASLYQTLAYAKAEHILRELLRMDPDYRDAALFLKKCLRKKETGLIQQTRALSIFLFLLAALVIAVEVLLVRPFYDLYTRPVEFSRHVIFGMGCLVLAGGNLLHRWRMERRVNRFVTHLRRR